MDIKCAVCGEPWDSYGVQHGDMAPWEAALFKKGAGCPSCEGTAPDDGRDHTEEHMRSVVFGGTDDPDSFPLLHAPDAKRPKWERPPDEVLFTCPGCDSQLTRDADMSKDAPTEDALSWSHLPSMHYYKSRDWPLDLDELHEVDGKKYCPGCVATCDDCGKPIFKSYQSPTGTVLFGDTYDAGASHADPRNPYGGRVGICTDCLEKIPTCAHCGEPLGDDEETDEDGRGECCAPKERTDESASEES